MIDRKKTGPIYMRKCIVCVSAEDAARVRKLIVKLGSIRKAIDALGIGDSTFAAAREEGRMQKKTYDRLREALDRVEAAA